MNLPTCDNTMAYELADVVSAVEAVRAGTAPDDAPAGPFGTVKACREITLATLEVMDEARRQAGITFPADKRLPVNIRVLIRVHAGAINKQRTAIEEGHAWHSLTGYARFTGGSTASPAPRSETEKELIATLQADLAGWRCAHPPVCALLWHRAGRRFSLDQPGLRPVRSSLTGWVKNLPDGTVEMELQGRPSSIIKHLDAVHALYSRGAYRIMLDEVQRREIIPDEDNFSVRF